jgi:hypothetical protein
MKKLSTILSDIIIGKPFLEEAIVNNYLNLTAFSEYIRPYIQKELQKDISIHAIKMALSRFTRPWEVPMNTMSHWLKKISTRTGLSILTLARIPKNIELITQFMIEKKRSDKHFFTIIEGVHEIDIIFAHDLRESIEEKFPSHSRLLLVSDLGLVTGELSDAEISTPWLFYTVTKRLAFHGVNIIQVLSTYHELWIIVREIDIKKALFILMD